MLRHVVLEPMFLLLLGTAVVYAALGAVQEAWTMVAAICAVGGIDLWGNLRSNRAVAALARVTARRAQVIREGEVREVDAAEVVVGDCLVCAEGTTVPADGLLSEAADFSVQESIMTGESIPVDKRAGDPVLAGTSVVRGCGWVTVTQVGQATALAGIGALVAATGREVTPLRRRVNRFVRMMLAVGSVAFVFVFVVQTLATQSLLAGLLQGLTLAMSIVPEEIPVALSTFLALGAYRLLRHGIIARTPGTVETLGSATVLALDKTGTLTVNQMTLHATADARPGVSALEWAVWASEPAPFDPMERSLHAAFRPDGAAWEGNTLVHEFPLEGHPPTMSHGFVDRAGQMHWACKGALEGVLALCAGLGEEERAAAQATAARWSEQGMRVLGVARVWEAGPDRPERPADLPWEWVGCVAFEDPVAPGIPEALSRITSAGLRPIMITGDAPETACAVARAVGIPGERVVTGPEWMGMTPEQQRVAVREVGVFARIRPEVKLQIVTALAQAGEVVAMTGDGVNDAPALKAAAIGIALGRRGTEVAQGAAGLVLSEDDLASLVPALHIGRRIQVNLRKALGYIVAIHVPIICLVVMPSLWDALPMVLFAPMHVVFLELVMGPTCSLAFEREPVDASEVSRPMPTGGSLLGGMLLGRSVWRGLAVAAACTGAMALTLEEGEGAVRTVAFLSLVVAQAGLAWVHRTHRWGANPWMAAAVIVPLAVAALWMAVPVLRAAFSFVPLSLGSGAIAVGAGLAGAVGVDAVGALFRRRLVGRRA
jgi:Ca2+-transporting ATPase